MHIYTYVYIRRINDRLSTLSTQYLRFLQCGIPFSQKTSYLRLTKNETRAPDYPDGIAASCRHCKAWNACGHGYHCSRHHASRFVTRLPVADVHTDVYYINASSTSYEPRFRGITNYESMNTFLCSWANLLNLLDLPGAMRKTMQNLACWKGQSQATQAKVSFWKIDQCINQGPCFSSCISSSNCISSWPLQSIDEYSRVFLP